MSTNRIMVVAAACCLALSLAHADSGAQAAVARIAASIAANERPDAAQAASLARDGAVLVDARSLEEWDAGHAKGAILMPWQQVDALAPTLLPDKNAAIVTYCAVGVRAWRAASSLRALGYTHVTAMRGGFADLEATGHPVAR